jgi:hypothetical protein
MKLFSDNSRYRPRSRRAAFSFVIRDNRSAVILEQVNETDSNVLRKLPVSPARQKTAQPPGTAPIQTSGPKSAGEGIGEARSPSIPSRRSVVIMKFQPHDDG